MHMEIQKKKKVRTKCFKTIKMNIIVWEIGGVMKNLISEL